MPTKTITLSDEESTELDLIATQQGVSADAILLAEAQSQIAAAKEKRIAEWWRDLPAADKERVYAAETAG